VPNIDYILSDEISTPSNMDTQQHYSEQIYRLPGCFFCFDYSKFDEPPIAEPPHLKNGHITFGCFGSGGKINREWIEVWAKLLHRVPGSILRIQNAQLWHYSDRRFMTERFRACGIPPERLALAAGVDRPTLLRIFSQIDINLDTWPYCGGNTVAESLWHGVPVVTYRGDRFSSAYGASLLTAAGCPDLVAETPEQYIDLAVELARSPERLLYLRHNLRRMSQEFGLGDSKRFARNLEAAYVDMLSRLNDVEAVKRVELTDATRAAPNEMISASAHRS
jgi:protein O-GlcNAc transferase